MAEGPNKPDFTLGVIHKETEKRSYVGAGWKNKDGSITITINACVVLNGNDPLALRLFPVFEKNSATKAPVSLNDDPAF